MNEQFKYFDGSLEEFLTLIKGMKENSLVKIKLMQSTALEDLGIVNDSFYHVLDNFTVKHIYNKHSNEKEVLRGQLIIEESDFLLITDIISHYDSRIIEKHDDGRILIVYTKSYPDCERYYVEAVRNGRHELAGVTYYKRKRKLTGAKS